MMHVNVTLNKFVNFYMGGECVDRGTHCISVDRDVPTKGILFAASVLNGGMSISKKSGKGFNIICLERVFMPILKGLINYEVHV